jgi:bifunctional non-homologous end joining protein LigD
MLSNQTITFYKPMLAKAITKPFSGKDWIFETKWDGFRAITYVKDDLFTVQSRNGNEFKRKVNSKTNGEYETS